MGGGAKRDASESGSGANEWKYFSHAHRKGIDSMIGWKRGDERRVGGASSLSVHTKMGEQKRKKCHIFKWQLDKEKNLHI